MSLDQEPNIEDSDDSDDEDYVYMGGENLPSEEDSDGEPEDDIEGDEDVPKHGHKRKGSQKSKRSKTSKVRKKDDGRVKIKVGATDDFNEENKQPTKLCEQEDKKKTDSLWEDFLKDTGSMVPKEEASSGTSGKNSSMKDSKAADIKTGSQEGDKQNKVLVTVTKVFQFAGEEVKLTKEVPADSLEAQISSNQDKSATPKGNKGHGINMPSKGSHKSDGGMNSILNQLGKKSKIGTLEKSKIDWEQFKKSEGLEEEIQGHNRGKAGYLEKQDFLQRADLRQFEIEKKMRTKSRSSRE